MEKFPLDEEVTEAEFKKRLEDYEDIINTFEKIFILLNRWGDTNTANQIEKSISRIAEMANVLEGPRKKLWDGIKWYPTLRLLYIGGISAVIGKRYDNLKSLLSVQVEDKKRIGETDPIILRVIDNISNRRVSDMFKTLPGHESDYTPISEYLFEDLQPHLEKALLVGEDYENYFDKFEIIFALIYASCDYNEDQLRVWGPTGRFAWKFRNASIRGGSNPFDKLVQKAKDQGTNWPPIQAGLFQGDIDRFIKISSEYRNDVLQELSWF